VVWPVQDPRTHHREGEAITIAKVNVDNAASLAQRYRVMSIPTLLVFNGGEEQKRLVGAQSKAKLIEELSL